MDNRFDASVDSLTVGLPRTGKTVYFTDKILEAIKGDNSVMVFDPYGDIASQVLTSIPQDKQSQIAYIAVGNKEFPVGINIFETTQEQSKDEICRVVMTLLYDLYDPHKTGIIGPRFEQAVRNAVLSILYDENASFIELMKCFSDASYINSILPKISDSLVRKYWTDQMAQTDDSRKSDILAYIMPKLGRFILDERLRNSVGQSKTTIDFEKLLLTKKVIIFDFSGLSGENESFYILASLLFAKLTHVIKNQQREQSNQLSFFLDEVSVWPASYISDLLKTGRMHGVSFHLTSQGMFEIESALKRALLRVASLTSFRLDTEDAKIIAPEFHSAVSVDDLCMLPKFHAYFKRIVDGNPQKAEKVDLTKPIDSTPTKSKEEIASWKSELGRVYARSRQEVEEEISRKSRDA